MRLVTIELEIDGRGPGAEVEGVKNYISDLTYGAELAEFVMANYPDRRADWILIFRRAAKIIHDDLAKELYHVVTHRLPDPKYNDVDCGVGGSWLPRNADDD